MPRWARSSSAGFDAGPRIEISVVPERIASSCWTEGALIPMTMSAPGDADLPLLPRHVRLVGEVRSSSGIRIDDDGVAEGDEPCDS